MLLIGIDEAGYGPLLGPLCHGVCVFRLHTPPSDAIVPDLWALLAPAVARCPAPAGALAVDDSKKLYSGPRKRERLLRTVACFLEASEREDEASRDAQKGLLERLLSAEELQRLEQDPWAKTRASAEEGNEQDPAACRLLRDRLKAAGIALLAFQAGALSARDFNVRLKTRGNKAEVTWERAGGLLRQAVDLATPGEPMHATIDRQGGRKFYGPRLGALFKGAFVWTEEESKPRSAYRLEHGGSELRVVFQEKAESAALPVALASLAAKLARELLMARFNAFFRAHDSEIKPTAGYYTDGKRFLKVTAAMRKQLKIADEDLIRKS